MSVRLAVSGTIQLVWDFASIVQNRRTHWNILFLLLLAFSCKTRCFCPSCQAKQVAAFLEQVLEEVLEEVDHRQLVWTIPRVLHPAFYKDRKLLGELCRYAWASLRDYVQSRLGPGSVPGAILTIQTWGDNLRPHALCGAPHKG